MIYMGLAGELYKPTEGQLPPCVKSISVSAARNSNASFHVLLGGEPFALNLGSSHYIAHFIKKPVLRVSAELPFGTALYHEQYHTDDDGARRADALLNLDTAEYETTAAVFVSVAIPASTAPGKYNGTIKLYRSALFGDEELIEQVSVSIDVYEYTMKPAKDFSFHLDLWQHLTAIARAHEAPLWSDTHFRIIESYVRSLSELGQKAISLVVSEVPWAGQSCFLRDDESNLFEHSIIPITRDSDGFSYDFSIMQRYIDLCLSYNICGEITLFGLAGIWQNTDCGFGRLAEGYPDAMRIRYMDSRDGCYKFMTDADDIKAYISALEQYFIDKSLINIVRVCADEPSDVENFRKSCEALTAAAGSFRLKTAINHSEFISEFSDIIDDFVPFIDCLAREPDKINEYRLTMPDKRFLWYVCCGPAHPNTFLRSPLRETLYIGVLTSYLELDGFLRWNYTVYNQNPRADIRYKAFPAGDINFVYPSPCGEAVLTLRWKALRRAVELYEMLEQAKKNGIKLDELFRTVIKEPDIRKLAGCSLSESDYMSVDDSDYYKLYNTLLEKLSKYPLS